MRDRSDFLQGLLTGLAAGIGIAALLRTKGFGEIEDMGMAAIAKRFLGRDAPDTPGPHVLRAARTGFVDSPSN